MTVPGAGIIYLGLGFPTERDALRTFLLMYFFIDCYLEDMPI